MPKISAKLQNAKCRCGGWKLATFDVKQCQLSSVASLSHRASTCLFVVMQRVVGSSATVILVLQADYFLVMHPTVSKHCGELKAPTPTRDNSTTDLILSRPPLNSCTLYTASLLPVPTQTYTYTVSQQNVPTFACYNFDTCGWISTFLAKMLPIK